MVIGVGVAMEVMAKSKGKWLIVLAEVKVMA